MESARWRAATTAASAVAFCSSTLLAILLAFDWSIWAVLDMPEWALPVLIALSCVAVVWAAVLLFRSAMKVEEGLSSRLARDN